MRRETNDDRALRAFLNHETYWPKGQRTGHLKVIAFDDRTVAFSYGEPIAVNKRNCVIRVVSNGTLMPELPGVFEWSMTTGYHIACMMSVGYDRRPSEYVPPEGDDPLACGTYRRVGSDRTLMPRKVKRVTRQELHRFLGWSCDPLPAVCRANKCGANTRFGDGRSFPKTGSFIVDPDRPPNQWARTSMGMYDTNPRYRR